MNRKKNLLVVAAQALHASLDRPHQRQAHRLERLLTALEELCQGVCRRQRHRATADQHRWLELDTRCRAELLGLATRLQLLTAELIATRDQAVPRAPPAGLLLAELRQLHDEFAEAHIDPKGQSISARTDPIVLEGIHLGPFSIVLNLNELATHRDSTCFECVALEPYPASRNASVTHPHVSDGALCAGDASRAIAKALGEGRLCEAFLLVRSVLSTYNSESPYVSLSDWEDGRCSDCDRAVSTDDLYRCDACGSYFCDQCISHCDLCDRSCCSSCLSRDGESDRYCCSNCCDHCSVCRRVVDSDSVDVVSGMCPQCIAHSGTADRQDSQSHSNCGDDTTPSDDASATERFVPTPTTGIPPSPPAPASCPPPWILICQCQSSESYPEVVYAALQIDPDQAAVLLGLRSTLQSIQPLLPDVTPQSIQVGDTRLRFASEFADAYEEARVEWDLGPWHTVASDPLSVPSQVSVEGDTLHITPYGIYWTVSPTQERYQIIQTDTLLWGQLQVLAAGQSPFAHFQANASPPQPNGAHA